MSKSRLAAFAVLLITTLVVIAWRVARPETQDEAAAGMAVVLYLATAGSMVGIFAGFSVLARSFRSRLRNSRRQDIDIYLPPERGRVIGFDELVGNFNGRRMSPPTTR